MADAVTAAHEAGIIHRDMSPEQVEGKNIDTRSDLFSLGIVYFQLLTGRAPFQGDADLSLWMHPVDGATPKRLTTEAGNPTVAWSRDGETMYFGLGGYANTATIWARSMTDGAERKVMELEGRPGRFEGSSLTTDGDYLYFSWRETLGDIWVMDVAE